MSLVYQYPSLTTALLNKIVRQILSAGSPEKVVLFGSRARGDNEEDSDLDILIIEESHLPRFQRSRPYRKALRGYFPAKDIVVWSPDEFKEWQQV